MLAVRQCRLSEFINAPGPCARGQYATSSRAHPQLTHIRDDPAPERIQNLGIEDILVQISLGQAVFSNSVMVSKYSKVCGLPVVDPSHKLPHLIPQRHRLHARLTPS